MTAPVTHELKVPGAVLRYDVRESEPAGGPVLVLIGSPMGAAGFGTLATYFTDRTIVTYDPRGVERSVRTDPDLDVTPEVHAADVRAVIEAIGDGPVDMFATSGGAVNALALVAANPELVRAARRRRGDRSLSRRPRHVSPERVGRRDGAFHRAHVVARSRA
jgi:pimeloyl-ACP methyl ester carboxylesterase